jgi:hypothetical protein
VSLVSDESQSKVHSPSACHGNSMHGTDQHLPSDHISSSAYHYHYTRLGRPTPSHARLVACSDLFNGRSRGRQYHDAAHPRELEERVVDRTDSAPKLKLQVSFTPPCLNNLRLTGPRSVNWGFRPHGGPACHRPRGVSGSVQHSTAQMEPKSTLFPFLCGGGVALPDVMRCPYARGA